MNATTLICIIDDRLKRCRETLLRKNMEYSDSEADALSNFREIAMLADSTPMQVAWSLLAKHLASVRTMVQSGKKHPAEAWDEKLGDCINYFLLIDTLEHEQHAEAKAIVQEHIATDSTKDALRVVQKFFYGEHCDHAKCRAAIDAALGTVSTE